MVDGTIVKSTSAHASIIPRAWPGGQTLSVGCTPTGLGADYFIVDDLLNAREAYSKAAHDAAGEWMTRAARSRLNDPAKGGFAVIGQRMHADDPIGRLLDAEPDAWRYIEMSAVAEDNQTFALTGGRRHERKIGEVLERARMPDEWLAQQRHVLGGADFSAQYQQRPIPEQGNLVRRDWFKTYATEPHRRQIRGLFQSWDVAMKTETMNDYSVCVTAAVGGDDSRTGDIYSLNVLREKLAYPDLKRTVAQMAQRWSPTNVIIEDKVTGTPLIQDLRAERIVRPIAYNPSGDKLQRLVLQSAKIEQGRVFLPVSAPWKDDFVTEIIAFPNGRHDDQVDALTQLLGYLDEKARRTVRQLKW